MNQRFPSKDKDFFMIKALAQAERALAAEEVPIGAVVVDQHGKIIARGFNQIEKKGSQCAHAEAIAIQRAGKKLGDWRLHGCWIYVTLEPCLMCFGLIQLSRIEGLVYGAPSTLFGVSLTIPKELPSYAKNLQMEGGVKEYESLLLLKKFFGMLRKKGKKNGKGKAAVSRED